MLVSMSPSDSYAQRDPKIIRLMSFEGSRESPPEVTIPLTGPLIGPSRIITVNNPPRPLGLRACRSLLEPRSPTTLGKGLPLPYPSPRVCLGDLIAPQNAPSAFCQHRVNGFKTALCQSDYSVAIELQLWVPRDRDNSPPFPFSEVTR